MGNEIINQYISDVQKYADAKAGITKDGKITADEKEAIKVFQDKVLEDYCYGETDLETFNKAMGLYKTNPVATTEAPAVEKAEGGKKSKKAKKQKKAEKEDKVTYTRKDAKDVKKAMKDYAENGTSLNGMMADLYAGYSTPNYSGVLEDVQEVVNVANDIDYTSKKDVKKIKKAIKEELKPENGVQRKAIRAAVDIAKNDQEATEADALYGIYEQVRKANPDGNTTTWLNETRAIIRKGVGTSHSYIDEGAWTELEKRVYGDIAGDVLYEISQSESTSKREIRRELQGNTAKSDEARKIYLEESEDVVMYTKLQQRKNVVEQRAEELEKVSEAELKDALGEDLFRDLYRTYLKDHKNPDGTFNARGLSDALVYRVSNTDYTMNQSDDTEEAERYNCRKEICELTGGLLTMDDIDNKAINKIRKLCKIKKESNDRSLASATDGALIPALTGALIAYLSDDTYHHGNYVVLDLALDSVIGSEGKNDEEGRLVKEAFLDLLKSKGVETKEIEIDGEVFVGIGKEWIKNVDWKDILNGFALGGLQRMATNLIFGQRKTFEESAYAVADFDYTNPRYTDFENYKAYIKARYPKDADIIIALATTMRDENGNFDAQKYDSIMKQHGGVASNFNKDEMAGLRLRMAAPRPDDLTESEQRLLASATPAVSVPAKDLECGPLSTYQRIRVQGSETYKREYKDTWTFIVETYYPDAVKKYGATKVIRELKKLWNIDKTDTDLPKEKPFPAEVLGFGKANPDEETIKKNRVKFAWKLPAGNRLVTSTPETGGYEAVNVTTGDKASGNTRQEAIDAVKKENYDKTDIFENGKRIGE